MSVETARKLVHDLATAGNLGEDLDKALDVLALEIQAEVECEDSSQLWDDCPTETSKPGASERDKNVKWCRTCTARKKLAEMKVTA